LSCLSMSHLVDLCISCQDFSYEWDKCFAGYLSDLIRECPSLRRLDLSGNRITGCNLLNGMAGSISSRPQLSQLILSNNFLDLDAVPSLLEIIWTCRSLREVLLDRNWLDRYAVRELVRGCASLPHGFRIDITHQLFNPWLLSPLGLWETYFPGRSKVELSTFIPTLRRFFKPFPLTYSRNLGLLFASKAEMVERRDVVNLLKSGFARERELARRHSSINGTISAFSKGVGLRLRMSSFMPSGHRQVNNIRISEDDGPVVDSSMRRKLNPTYEFLQEEKSVEVSNDDLRLRVTAKQNGSALIPCRASEVIEYRVRPNCEIECLIANKSLEGIMTLKVHTSKLQDERSSSEVRSAESFSVMGQSDECSSLRLDAESFDLGPEGKATFRWRLDRDLTAIRVSWNLDGWKSRLIFKFYLQETNP